MSSPMGRILVIDDHAESASALAALIQVMGHHAHSCQGCTDVATLAPTFRPDVVFIDVAMPEVKGLECARQLRDLLGTSVRLIAMTRHSQESWPDQQDLFEMVLRKPVMSKTVIELIGENPGRI